MITERPLTRKKRLAEEATRKMLERIAKFVVYNRHADDRHISVELIGAKINECIVYNDKEYEIQTQLSLDDILRIRRETAKKG